MDKTNEALQNLGFNDWYRSKVPSHVPDGCTIVRVISVNKNNYVVFDGKHELLAELTGKFMFSATSALEYPTVGDWVIVTLFNDNTFAVIHEVLQRKSLLKRKSAGDKTDFQLIAANVDCAIIIQAVDHNFNLRRLERYLVVVRESGVEPIILLSKADLIAPEAADEKKAAVQALAPGVTIISFSNTCKSDIAAVENIFKPARTYALLGSSGVGKTTLINNLLRDKQYKTLEVREKDSRGRHTTTRRELVLLHTGALLIDNPGMRELGVISVEAGLDETFSEIVSLTEDCRFSDCTHTVESGCAVLAALQDGTLSKARYTSYFKMKKESAYNELTYVEKRQKEKSFGKQVKSILKSMPKKR